MNQTFAVFFEDFWSVSPRIDSDEDRFHFWNIVIFC